jgi:amino acid adenylation domain-containing protein
MNMSPPAAKPKHAQDLTEERPTVNADRNPLSFAQQRLWFLDQLQPGDPAYNIPQAWRLHGALNLAAFERALDEVAARHEILRTTFGVADGQPVQHVAPAGPIQPVFTDLSAEKDPEAEAQRLIARDAQRPFDLRLGPLWRVSIFRLKPDEHQVLFNLHHIIADAWSFEILRNEMVALYEAFCAGRPSPLSELPIQYLDFACWQREQMRGDRIRAELDFWKQRLGSGLPDLELPLDHPRTSRPRVHGCSAPFELSRACTASLKDLGRREGATLFMVLLASFNTFLHRLTGQDDFVIGAPSSGRDRTETEGLVGLFVNTLALRTDAGGNPTFLELLARVRETVLDAFAHQDMPFEELVKALAPERAAGQNPLFQTVLALQNGYPPEWPVGNLRATLIEVETPTAKFDWTFLLEETESGLKGRLEYKTDLFEAESIACFLQQFRFLLEGIASNPRLRLSEFPLLTDAGRRQLLEDWNQTATAYERDACIAELFEGQVEKCPDAIALVCGDRQMTYRQLNERANQLARRLKKSGAGPDMLIGLCLDRSLELIVAMLAILKAGAAYVPLDRTYPPERLQFMLHDAKVTLIVTDSKFEIRSPQSRPVALPPIRNGEPTEDSASASIEPQLRIIRVDSDQDDWRSESGENFHSGAGPDNLAYVMYTSGSTGTPKGVAIPHRGVVRLVRHTNYVTFAADDVFLQLAPVSFDASTFEIWGCLLNGAKLVIFPPHCPSLEELGRTIRQHRVSILWLTAGFFHQMVDHQLEQLKSVRQLLAGGDVLSASHVQRVARELPGCQLINGYGPTENTTFTCCYRIPSGWQGHSVPIGRPISNTKVYVLDKNLAPVAIRVPGELCIGGDGLARGYWQRPELTLEKFVPDPLDSKRPPGRLYRTGDLVRWRTDGQLEFLGRIDQQVKIRGFRVEPGETEAALVKHPAVRAAAVIARDTATRDRQLVAYVVLDLESRCELAELIQFLESKLPAWMVPARFVELKELPLTANGKVDRRALPEPDEAEPSRSFAPARNRVEEALLCIWREILGRNSFGIHDNFFRLGGHSLLATQMISRIGKAFHIELPVRSVFEKPTIAGLAETLGGNANGDATAGVIPRRIRRAQAQQWLTRIDTLSDAEVETLLGSPDLKQT